MKEKKAEDNKKQSEFIKRFKKRWLVKGINTVFLIAILIAIFVGINFAMKKWDPTPIDVTKSQDFTLTEESKNRVKDIKKDVNIYFIGWDSIGRSEMVSYYPGIEAQADIAKQYNKANSKIKVQVVDTNKNIELAKKYNVKNEDYKIIVECGKNSRILTADDIISFDDEYYTSNIAEQKITSAIVNVTADKIPKVYFLTGYSSFDLSGEGLSVFEEYLENEVLTYESLNILNKQKVPDDCDTLIITTPQKDFDNMVADAIINYIKKGGNILWFNGMYKEEKDFKNVNRVLAQYGVEKFEKGIIYETDTSKILLGYAICFTPEIEDTEILENVKTSAGAVVLNATKINLANENALSKLKVEKTDLITVPETAYFTKNLTSKFNQKEDKKGSFVLGTQLVKTISKEKEAVTSTLVIYGNDYFISDYPVQNGQYSIPLIELANNKDVALNSLAMLTNNDKEIIIRKNYSDSQTSFTPSERAKTLITITIFAVPFAIIVIGIIVWIIRKRRV